MPQDETWSWIKFLKGPFVGKNWAKALIMLVIQILIICIIGALVFSILQIRGCQKQQSETKIGTNSGVVNQVDNHATTSVVHNHFPLSDIFSNILSFGAKNRVDAPNGKED